MAKIKGHDYDEDLYGGNASDVIMGLGGNDLLYGGNGDDTIFGGKGQDFILGDRGSDVLYGEAGNDGFVVSVGYDRVDGGSGYDYLNAMSLEEDQPITVDCTAGTLIYETGSGSQTTKFKNIEFIMAGMGDDVLTASDEGGIRLTGNSGDDIIIGGAGEDSFYGEGGTDTLTGAGGDDWFGLSEGNDSLDGGEGHDGVDFSEIDTGLVYSIGQTVLDYESDGNPWTATLTSIENVFGSQGADTLTGDDSVNFIAGGSGNDTIKGNDGDDVISGGMGNDKLTGGAGKDLFVFAHMDVATGQDDVIKDFVSADDDIMLDGEKFWSLIGKGKSQHLSFYDYQSLQASQFQSSDDFFAHNKNVRLIYETDTGTLYYDHDGSKLKIDAIEVAHLDPGTELTAADLFVGTFSL